MQTRLRKSDFDIGDQLQKGFAYHKSARYKDAQEVYRNILKVDPLHPDALNLLGLLAIEAGNLERAEMLISRAIQSDSVQPDYYNNLGNVLLEKRSLKEAAHNFQKAVALNPGYAAAYFNLANVNQQMKQWPTAIANYCRALEIEPGFFQAWFNLALAYRTENQIIQAIDSLNNAIQINPEFAEAYAELASIYRDMSRPDQAIVYYEKSLELEPDRWASCFNLGNLYREQNKIEHAILWYNRALRLNPESAETILNMGLTYKLMGKLSEAERCYRKCTDISPNLAEGFYNLGNLYKDSSRYDQAVYNYRRSLNLNPEMTAVLNNLGEVYRQQGLFDAAVDCFNRSLSIEPHHPETLHNLGNALIKLNRAEEAIEIFKQALAIKPELGLAHNSMGSAYMALDRIDQSAECYRQALNMDPAAAAVWFNLGLACQSQGKVAESKEYFRQALNSDPEMACARWQYHLLLPVLYQNEQEIAQYRQIFETGLVDLIDNTVLNTPEQRKQALAGISSNTNFYLSYQGKDDAKLQIEYGNLTARIMSENYPQWSRIRNLPRLNPASKIKVGFVSAYMYSHTVGVYLKGWSENINSQNFETYGYHIGNKADNLTEQFKSIFDHYHAVSNNLEQAAKQITSDNLHVLVFTDIGMNPLSIQLGALRLAPVQCASWGHPVTTGLPTMDYFLSSDLMEPQDAQSHYSERLVRLPNIALCYQKPGPPDVPADRQFFEIDEHAFVYLSPQSLFKYLPQYDTVFPRIAQRVANAKFIFIAHQSEHVTRAFKKRLCIAFEQYQLEKRSFCQFLTRLNFDKYLSLNLVSNVLLDPPSWSGGKTSLEGIACGLPPVTVPAEFMRGRHTYAMLKMMGIDDTIAGDIDEYVEIAVRLGKDDHFYSGIKQKIRSRCQRLFDDFTVPLALEEFFKRAVKRLKESD